MVRAMSVIRDSKSVYQLKRLVRQGVEGSSSPNGLGINVVSLGFGISRPRLGE